MPCRIPLLSKWLTAVQTNLSASSVCVISEATVEYLGVTKEYSPWDYSAIPQPWTIGPGPAGMACCIYHRIDI